MNDLPTSPTAAQLDAKMQAETINQARPMGGSALGPAATGYPTPYSHTREDFAAASRLQIWQEIMRHPAVINGDGTTTVDPEGAADAACHIFDKFYGR